MITGALVRGRVIDSHPQRASELTSLWFQRWIRTTTIWPPQLFCRPPPKCRLPPLSVGICERRRPAPKFAGAVGRGYILSPELRKTLLMPETPKFSGGTVRQFSDYLAQYEAATDALIADGFLLSGFKDAYMQVARDNAFFPIGLIQCGSGFVCRCA